VGSLALFSFSFPLSPEPSSDAEDVIAAIHYLIGEKVIIPIIVASSGSSSSYQGAWGQICFASMVSSLKLSLRRAKDKRGMGGGDFTVSW
jgi:hypothetical protein